MCLCCFLYGVCLCVHACCVFVFVHVCVPVCVCVCAFVCMCVYGASVKIIQCVYVQVLYFK